MNWDEHGTATFHIDCWNALRRSASAETPASISIVLTEMEKDMIKEAARTAETHYSSKSVEQEGERIANLLKSSNYCIAFTGKNLKFPNMEMEFLYIIPLVFHNLQCKYFMFE